MTPDQPLGDLAVRCDNLVHVYGTPGSEVAALRGIDLTIPRGRTLALLGPSGSGKSTLLWHLAGLLQPTAGSVDVCGHRLAGLDAAALADFRRQEIGVVLQNATRNVLPYLSALDNIRAVQQRSRRRGGAGRRRAMDLLDGVGIGALARRRAGQLSGGEQQRLSLAIALANEPAVLLADEPTSQLDPDSANAVLDLLRTFNRQHGTTIVVVTHDPTVGAALERTLTIRDGRVGGAGFAGEQFVPIDRDGGLQLPVEMLDLFPPGSLARAERQADGVLLRPVRPDETESDQRDGGTEQR